MIEINLSVEYFTLTIKGHAEPEESELFRETCAAASMLAQGLAASIAKFQRTQNGMREMTYRGDPGDMLLQVKPETWAEATIRKRMRAYGDGLELLAKSNPESVRMTWDGIEIRPEEGNKIE